jgi:outer membrane usher protein
LLTLKVNQEDKGEVLVYLSSSDVLIRVLDLTQAGLKNFSGKREMIKGEAYVSLASLAPGLKYQFDERALSLEIVAQPRMLGRESRVNLAAGEPAGITYSNNNSAFFNYSLNLNQFDLDDLNAFVEGGISFGNNLAYSSVMRNSDGRFVRGLSNLTLDNPETMTTWTLGDFLSNTPDPIGGSNFLGGVSYATNFGLNPYFIQFPMPTLAGALTTPSTLDIYVNGRLVRQEELPPGKFQLSNIPGNVGAGNTQVVIRDVFGNQSSIGSPYYLATHVLSQGLSDFGYSLGFVRHDLNTESFDYDAPAFIGYDRYGFTRALTAGIRLEAQHNMVSGGPLFSIAMPYGELDFSGAGSLASGYFGGALAAGYSYVTQKFSIGAFVTAMSSNYSNTSLEPQSDRQTLSSSLNLGFPIGDLITITPQLLCNVDRDLGTSWWAMLTAYLRVSERISIVASASQSRQAGNGNYTSGSISLVYFFGRDITATLAWNHQDKGDGGSLMVQKALPVGPGYAYQLQGQTGAPGNQFNGMFQYQTTFGQYLFDYSHIENQDQT